MTVAAQFDETNPMHSAKLCKALGFTNIVVRLAAPVRDVPGHFVNYWTATYRGVEYAVQSPPYPEFQRLMIDGIFAKEVNRVMLQLVASDVIPGTPQPDELPVGGL